MKMHQIHKSYRIGIIIGTAILLMLGLWVFETFFCQEQSTNGIPPMPAGYSSENSLKLAYTMGRIKMIDPVNIVIPDDILEEKDIEYGKVGDRSLQLDLYRPKQIDKPLPGIIFIHGGGWKNGNRADMKFYAVQYAQKGYVTATISYRLLKEALFPAAVQDAKCSVRWMRAHASEYGIDPDRIVVSGNSAGGHLSLMVGYTSDVPELEGDGGNPDVSSRVQAVIDFYGPTDFTTDFAKSRDEPKNFLGKTYEEDPKLYEFASPIFHLDANDPPTLILHGSIDSTVPIDQGDSLAEKLKELGIFFEYEKFEGWPHTMDLVESVNRRCQYRMDEFLTQVLKKAN